MRRATFAVVCVVVVVVVAGSACATTTRITTEPPAATVSTTKDGKPKDLGKAPLAYETKMWLWDSEKLDVAAPGHKPKKIELKRSELDVTNTIIAGCLTLTCCGAVVGVPIFLAGGFELPPETKVVLDKDPGLEPKPPLDPAKPATGADAKKPTSTYGY